MSAIIKLGKTIIKRNDDNVYIIAEIGQNHQGNLETAKQMIMEAKRIGCDCVKFQKSCLEAKFTAAALQRKYEDAHSWGNTYGEHKMHLEFSIAQYQILKELCEKIDLDFTASAMDEVSLRQLDALDVPFIKIGSGDANNFPLLKKAAQLKRPLVISTGMQNMKTINRIVEIMKENNKFNYALMHCISAYPTQPQDCRLRMITLLKQKFPDVLIGYSGHELGIEISKAAVSLGARILERHFTLDKKQKGSDHQCSLEPQEMEQLVFYIRSLKSSPLILSDLQDNEELMAALNPIEERRLFPCELKCHSKLGKSLVAARCMSAGKILDKTDVLIKVSEPSGISADEYYNVIGAQMNEDIYQDSPLLWRHIKK
uniref:AFP-like domain-containing protein n=1 Tax=Glossina pallidipes TaxID=7398 RepID=A0A1B0A0F3_GLOPL